MTSKTGGRHAWLGRAVLVALVVALSGCDDTPSAATNPPSQSGTPIAVQGVASAVVDGKAAVLVSATGASAPLSGAVKLTTQPRESVTLMVDNTVRMVALKTEADTQVQVSPRSTAVWLVLKARELTGLPSDKLKQATAAVEAHAGFAALLAYVELIVNSGVADPLDPLGDPYLASLINTVAKDIQPSQFAALSLPLRALKLLEPVVMAMVPAAQAQSNESNTLGADGDASIVVSGDKATITNYRFTPFMVRMDDGASSGVFNLVSGRTDSLQFAKAETPIVDGSYAAAIKAYIDLSRIRKGSADTTVNFAGLGTGRHTLTLETFTACRMLTQGLPANDAQAAAMLVDMFNLLLLASEVTAVDVEANREVLKEFSKDPKKYVAAIEALRTAVTYVGDQRERIKAAIPSLKAAIGLLQGVNAGLVAGNSKDPQIQQFTNWAKFALDGMSRTVEVLEKFTEASGPDDDANKRLDLLMRDSLAKYGFVASNQVAGYALGFMVGRAMSDPTYAASIGANPLNLFAGAKDFGQQVVSTFKVTELVEIASKPSNLVGLDAYRVVTGIVENPVLNELFSTVLKRIGKATVPELTKKVVAVWRTVDTGWSIGTKLLPAFWDGCTVPTQLSIDVSNGVASNFIAPKVRFALVDTAANAPVYRVDELSNEAAVTPAEVTLWMGRSYRVEVSARQSGVLDKSLPGGTDVAHMTPDANFLTSLDSQSLKAPQTVYSALVTYGVPATAANPKPAHQRSLLHSFMCTRKGLEERGYYGPTGASLALVDSGRYLFSFTNVKNSQQPPYTCAEGSDTLLKWAIGNALAFKPGLGQVNSGIEYDTTLWREYNGWLPTVRDYSTWDELTTGYASYGFGGTYRLSNTLTLVEEMDEIQLVAQGYALAPSDTRKFGFKVVTRAVDSLSCSNAVQGKALSCVVTGRNLPTALRLRGTACLFSKSAGASASSQTFTCTPANVGTYGLVLDDGADLTLKVQPIVIAGATVSSLSCTNKVVGQTMSCTVTGENLSGLSITTTNCGGYAELAGGTEQQRRFTCTPSGATVAVSLSAPGAAAPVYSSTVTVGSTPGTTSKLPHSGITSAQCYQAGSDTLVACSSAGAIALSGAGKQDGMLANVNTMSYGNFGSYSKEECVMDNVTKLMWEGKAASGTRAGSNRYTNYGDGRAGDASAYVAVVNAQGLCGFNDWRLPTVDELQSIVDYSKASPGPTINSTWFPNTASSYYWSSSPFAGSASLAWYVYFYGGGVDGNGRSSTGLVRLVRASQ